MNFSPNFVPITHKLLLRKPFTKAKIKYLFYKNEEKSNQEII